jgi:hypothetical protein
MSTTAGIASVRRVDDDITECRRCCQPIDPGRRVAFVPGTGNVCLRCLIAPQPGSAGQKTAGTT